MEQCPCGSKKHYSQCCGIFIMGQQLPASPEELMRSRYTAYTQANIEYIEKTMKSPANDNFAPEEAREWAQSAQWLKLEVVSASQQTSIGFVEFLAHYMYNGKKHITHEISEFHLIANQWFYVNGKGPDKKTLVKPSYTVGRNDLCPCGSTKKYKKCCVNLR